MSTPKFRNYSKPEHPSIRLRRVAANNGLTNEQRALLMSVPLRGTDSWREREILRVMCGAHVISVGDLDD